MEKVMIISETAMFLLLLMTYIYYQKKPVNKNANLTEAGTWIILLAIAQASNKFRIWFIFAGFGIIALVKYLIGKHYERGIKGTAN